MLNAHDRDIVGRDSGIKGLSLLLQPEVLADLLAEQQGKALPGPIRVTYLRYKPGVNCIARLETGDLIGYAKAFGGDAGSKLDKARKMDGANGNGHANRVILDGPGILVSFFPNDSKLSSLARLADPGQRQALLARIFKDDASWRMAGIATLNYKPERRYVARLDHPDGRSATLKFFGSREFDAIRRSRKKLRLPDTLKVSEWIGGSKHHAAMAYEWLPGVTLAERLEQGHAEDAAYAGQAIARLHASEQTALGERASRDPLEVLAALAEQLSWMAPDLAGEAGWISTALGRWWAAQPQDQRPVHGDFYDRQVIVHSSGIGIIDTDSAHLGSPQEDLGCFLAHLERRGTDGTLTETLVTATGQALRDGYRAIAPSTALEALDMHTALNLYKLAPHPFRDRSPDWPEQTRRLLSRCRQLMQPFRKR